MKRFTRRTPPLLMGVVALALMLSIFPSALHIPLSGPGGAAEIAPIPGQGNQQANLSAGNAASSGGVGSSGSAVEAGGSPPTPPGGGGGGGGGSAPYCVGDPARQTDDPLSPPCVPPGWPAGKDNGGATAPGVDAKTIQVILSDTEGRAGTTDGRVFTAGGVQATDDPYQLTVKRLLTFFQSRFATYGRNVVVTEQSRTGSGSANQATDAKAVVAHHPFAVILQTCSFLDFTTYVESAANGGVITIPCINEGRQTFPRAFLQAHSPYVWTFQPALEDEEASTAAFLCREIAGRPATRGGPAVKGTPRKVGMIYETTAGNFTANDATVLQSAVRAACGLTLDAVASDGTQQGSQTAVSRMALDKVTTVVCECEGTNAVSAADTLAPPYQPEWFVNADSVDSDQYYGRQVKAQDQWADAFALNYRWLVPPLERTYWYEAYSQISTDGQFDGYFGFGLYESLLMLFTMIQRAGPDLTPAHVQRGLEGYSRPSPGPGSPSGMYTAADHSFLQDQVLEIWNGSEVPPGGGDPSSSSGSVGCYMLADGGARHTPDAWPDVDQTGGSGPCSADLEPHTNSNADSGGGTPGPGFH